MRMTSKIGQRHYLLRDLDTGKALAFVEAADVTHAIERGKIICEYAGIFDEWIVLSAEESHLWSGLPSFLEKYFEMLGVSTGRTLLN